MKVFICNCQMTNFSTKIIALFSQIPKLHFYIETYSEAYLETYSVESGTSKVELFAKLVNS